MSRIRILKTRAVDERGSKKKGNPQEGMTMRNCFMSAAVAVCMAFGAGTASAQDETIRMGTMVWEDLTPISMITKKFLEHQGYTVELTTFSEWGISFSALANKDVDILASQINYVASDYWDRTHNQLEKVSVLSHGLKQGIVVPSYMNIDSVEQLNEIKDDVGGKIVGIEPGSGLMRDVSNAVDEYDLDYDVIDGSTAAMVAALKSAMDRQQPIVTMLWDPSWMVQAFDVKFLDDPKNVFPPAQTYYWLGYRGFSTEHPGVREALASVYIPIEDISKLNSDVNEGMTVEQAVDAWWEKNATLVERWSVLAKD